MEDFSFITIWKSIYCNFISHSLFVGVREQLTAISVYKSGSRLFKMEGNLEEQLKKHFKHDKFKSKLQKSAIEEILRSKWIEKSVKKPP